MRTKIEVTQEDIDRGTPSARTCPIARAVDRLCKPTFVVAVCQRCVLFHGLASLAPDYESRTSRAAKAFIARFDNGRPVKPFSFVLDIPAEVLK